jgi:uncharacterized LabA/DUF88 family protein
MIGETFSPLKRIAVFYDGSFFSKVSGYYKHNHSRASFLSFNGLHDFIRNKVAEKETGQNTSLCQIVESHFFRGRFSLTAVQAMPNPQKTLEADRFYDQLLMHAGIVTHFYPMNELVTPPQEKGIDVWLALEAYDLAVHKRFDVLILFAGDQDFVPLIRKLNGLGTRVMTISVNILNDKNGNKLQYPIITSQKLIEESSYVVMINKEIDSKKAKGDSLIDSLFVC